MDVRWVERFSGTTHGEDEDNYTSSTCIVLLFNPAGYEG